MPALNKHLPTQYASTDPLEHITELYHTQAKALAEKVQLAESEGRDTSFLKVKQAELCGAIDALSKVRQLQNYTQNYDILTVAERKKIFENTNKVN